MVAAAFRRARACARVANLALDLLLVDRVELDDKYLSLCHDLITSLTSDRHGSLAYASSCSQVGRRGWDRTSVVGV